MLTAEGRKSIEYEKDVSVSPNSSTGRVKLLLFMTLSIAPPFNWAPERMKIGGMNFNDVQKSRDEIFTPALSSIKKAAIKVGDDTRRV